jgi:hypothetical protein
MSAEAQQPDQHDLIQTQDQPGRDDETDPRLATVQEMLDNKLRNVDNPEEVIWHYFYAKMCGNKPGYTCKCCHNFHSTNLTNPAASMNAHLGNGACTKYSDAGKRARQVIQNFKFQIFDYII